MLGSPSEAFAQTQSPGVKIYQSPGSEAWAEEQGMEYAEAIGEVDLKTAIELGDIEVRVGDPGGNNAATVETADGRPLIVVRGDSAELAGYGVIHEWTHIRDGHPSAPLPGSNPSDGELQVYECSEFAAHCDVLRAMKLLYVEHGLKPACSLLRSVAHAAGWTALYCTWGVNSYGPPSPDPCGVGVSQIPCRK